MTGSRSRFRTGARHAVPLLALVACATAARAQQTTAGRSDYTATSSYADVGAFLGALQARGAGIRVGTLATSVEGRDVWYVIASRPMVTTPIEAHRTGKPIIYVQGNIHAGEVEGKEALQMLLRDLTLGPLRPLLDSVIIVAVPIYNADGNEHLAPGERNRPGQNGPALVGERANGQRLDLNRDYVKREAPETSGSQAFIAEWEPDLFVDLHTTNGSYHGYVLTYAPGLNPNVSPAVAFVRDVFLPRVRERMRERHGQETFWYGNFRNQEPDSLAQGWETYDPRPRFGVNWFGLRGGMAILSEAYSNADFRTRVSATYNFVREVLSFAAEQRETIRRIAREGWALPDSVAVRSVLGPPSMQDVIAEITSPAGEGNGGYARRKRSGIYRTIRMPVFDRFVPARREAMPAAYLIPPGLPEVVALLRGHGITVERLTAPVTVPGERFRVDSVRVFPLFEGHRTVSAEGAWRPATIEAAPGWFVVRTAQRLGVLAAYLLEPASEDGVVTWNLLDRWLRAGTDAPVTRVPAWPGAPAIAP
ncbi:MAG: M14 family metallopeptidase [Gemmatimonadota bacterium]